MNHALRNIILQQNHTGYQTDYSEKYGLKKIKIAPGVFRTDISFLGKYTANYLFKNPLCYEGKTVLDMGCGCGILSLIMASMGARKVLAVDINPVAVANTLENAKTNHLKNIQAIKSDLFSDITDFKFDLIVFNAPFYVSKSNDDLVTLTVASDSKLMKRFLSKAPKYLKKHGRIIIPQSNIHGDDNDPIKVAKNLGFSYKILGKGKNKIGERKIIEICPVI